jgi:hypothetical protein
LDIDGDGLDELLVLEDNRVQVCSPVGIKGTGLPPGASLTNWHAGSHSRWTGALLLRNMVERNQ